MDKKAYELLLEVTEHFSGTLEGIKFNLGFDHERLVQELGAVSRLSEELPGHARLLCECNPGTVLERPEEALRAFQNWPERVGAILHPFANMQLSRWLELLAQRSYHLHLQLSQEGHWEDPLPDLPSVKDALELLWVHGFQGTASLEFIATNCTERSPDLLMAAARSVPARWEGLAVSWRK